jgi:2-oxoglutarate ferredoxin oxidoreductase subunit alpha
VADTDLSIRIAGEAGQGVESSGAGFALALARGGLHIFAEFDYHSRIRGGFNYAQIRISEHPLYSHSEPFHLLLALNEDTLRRYGPQTLPGGAVLYDEALQLQPNALPQGGFRLFPVPLTQIAREVGGSELMANTAALAAAAAVIGFELQPMERVIEQNFRRKGEAVVEGNRRVARATYEWTRERYAAAFPWKVTVRPAQRRMVLNGNEAFALGALLGGCRFVAGYPMTPGSPVLEWLAERAARYGLAVMQVEDEIAAACAAIGAGHAGARALVPTSGGGFSLMVEALGLAGMTETPVVFYEAQRPGPSTGMATRTEQGDLLFVLHASQGEFPRIVLAPGTIEQAFEAGWRAFNLAERYQCPVIVLSDHYLATSLRDVSPEELGLQAVTVDRGEWLDDVQLEALPEPYRRYRLTPNGVSPRAVPGHPQAVYSATSDEHDEFGHIEEDAVNRARMHQKRMRKLETACREMRPPTVYGTADAPLTLVGWGSAYGPLRETVDRLLARGRPANMLHFVDLWPMPVEAVSFLLARMGQLVAVESNYRGQLADLIRMSTGWEVSRRLLKYDGRPLSPDWILERLEMAAEG